jgi:hypothetical protein
MVLYNKTIRDSPWEFSITYGSRIAFDVGTNYKTAYKYMKEEKDTNISTPDHSTSKSLLNLKLNQGVNINCSLNLTGRRLIGTDLYNHSASILTTSQSMLNLNSNKGVNINSSLNVTGKALIGTDLYNHSDSILEGFEI